MYFILFIVWYVINNDFDNIFGLIRRVALNHALKLHSINVVYGLEIERWDIRIHLILFNVYNVFNNDFDKDVGLISCLGSWYKITLNKFCVNNSKKNILDYSYYQDGFFIIM